MRDIALADTLTLSNVNWSNPTQIFDTSNADGDANTWIAPDDGIVHMQVQSSNPSCVEVYLYVGSTYYNIYSYEQRAGWACAYVLWVKKGQEYRIHTRGDGTIYTNKAYFYPLINPIR